MRRTTFAAALVALVATTPALAGTAAAQEPDAEEETGEDTPVVARHVGVPGVMMWSRAARRGHLGVSVEDVDGESAEQLGLSEVRGARVVDVAEGSPAAEGGLQEDDVIVRYNEEAVESVAELVRLVRETPPGRQVALRLVRDGGTRDLTVEVGEREPPFDRARLERIHKRVEHFRDRHGEEMEELRERMGDMEFDVESEDGAVVIRARRGRMGVRLESLTDQLAAYFGVGDRGGALVASVRDDSPAARAGIRAGDVIVSVDDEETGDPADVADAVRGAEAGPVTVTVVRGGEARSVTVELPGRDGMSMAPAAPDAGPGAARLPRPPTPGLDVAPPAGLPPVAGPPRGPGQPPGAPGPLPTPPGPTRV